MAVYFLAVLLGNVVSVHIRIVDRVLTREYMARITTNTTVARVVGRAKVAENDRIVGRREAGVGILLQGMAASRAREMGTS